MAMLVGDVRRASPASGSNCTLSGGRKWLSSVTYLSKNPQVSRARSRRKSACASVSSCFSGLSDNSARYPGPQRNSSPSPSAGKIHSPENSPGISRIAAVRQGTFRLRPLPAASAETTQSNSFFWEINMRYSARAAASSRVQAMAGNTVSSAPARRSAARSPNIPAGAAARKCRISPAQKASPFPSHRESSSVAISPASARESAMWENIRNRSSPGISRRPSSGKSCQSPRVHRCSRARNRRMSAGKPSYTETSLRCPAPAMAPSIKSWLRMRSSASLPSISRTNSGMSITALPQYVPKPV